MDLGVPTIKEFKVIYNEYNLILGIKRQISFDILYVLLYMA